ncbi:MAG: tetratricopeptide repeat protein [Xanthobacteraceae bacterium]|nr:tetratricopeptide repeat protein [Xanthobacteraceae bacterium]
MTANGPSQASGGDDDTALARAMLCLEQGRPQDAEPIAAEMLKADPHDTGALYVLGCALTMQGRAGEAIAPLEAAAGARDDPALHTALAIALRQAGRNDDAVRSLKLTIARHREYAAAFLELGHLLVSMDRHDEAVDVLARGLDIAPTMPQLPIQLGYAQLSRGDCNKARDAFARALEISPGSHDALFGMAKAHQEIGENSDAAAWFRRYLAERPNDASALLGLGHCLLELGELDAGYDCFRRAAQGGAQRYGSALTSLASAARGRFWLKPSRARQFFGD